jgi:hypothetical protein
MTSRAASISFCFIASVASISSNPASAIPQRALIRLSLLANARAAVKNGAALLQLCFVSGIAAPSRSRSKPATSSARTHRSKSSLSAMMRACSYSKGLSSPAQIAIAICSSSAKSIGLRWMIAESPCRNALRLARALPAAVRGPRLLRPFLRLAVICFSEVTVILRLRGRETATRGPPEPRARYSHEG